MVSIEHVSEHVGDEPSATFEVARGTDTEEVEADPNSVAFGQRRRGPVILLNYSKYHAFLPPWNDLVAFTLEGDGRATFAMPEYLGQRITGDLKTVEICSPTVKLE